VDTRPRRGAGFFARSGNNLGAAPYRETPFCVDPVQKGVGSTYALFRQQPLPMTRRIPPDYA
jgi:hypothetical protein